MVNRSLPSTSTCPREGCASHPMTYRSDDLPQPEGPITLTNSPGSTLKLTPRSAGTSTFPARYSFQRFSVTTIGSTLDSLVEKSTSAGRVIVDVIAISDYTCQGMRERLGLQWGGVDANLKDE